MKRSIALLVVLFASACFLSDAFAPSVKRHVFQPASCRHPPSRILRMSDEKKSAEGAEEVAEKAEPTSGTFYDDEVRTISWKEVFRELHSLQRSMDSKPLCPFRLNRPRKKVSRIL